jgi:hypothetical protein
MTPTDSKNCRRVGVGGGRESTRATNGQARANADGMSSSDGGKQTRTPASLRSCSMKNHFRSGPRLIMRPLQCAPPTHNNTGIAYAVQTHARHPDRLTHSFPTPACSPGEGRPPQPSPPPSPLPTPPNTEPIYSCTITGLGAGGTNTRGTGTHLSSKSTSFRTPLALGPVRRPTDDPFRSYFRSRDRLV